MKYKMLMDTSPLSMNSLCRDPDGKPARAYQGEDYKGHLRQLMAEQSSPSVVSEPLRQHLQDLLSRQTGSPTVNRANSNGIPPGA